MKKWKDYSKSEKGMIITIGILILLIVMSSGRVQQGIRKGFNHFFSAPVEKESKL